MQLEMPNLRQISDNSYATPAMPDWLRAQACLDWHAAGLPDFGQWDQALVSLAYLMAHSHSPMALMLGAEGVLFANESAQHLFVGDEGACNARSVLEVVPRRSVIHRGREASTTTVVTAAPAATLAISRQRCRTTRSLSGISVLPAYPCDRFNSGKATP